jgi:phosphotriesterase-related protein
MTVRRREFLGALAGAAFAQAPQGTVLVHEHVLVDFTSGKSPYDPQEVFRIARPHLEAVKKLGVRRFQDCTPNFIGRNPKLLQRLMDATGLEIWTNTGLYAARNHQYLPPYTRTETPDQLARRWTAEYRSGVDGMKPRFLKIGVNNGPLVELDRKIVRAAAICSRDTGLPIQSHTGNGIAAWEQVEIVTGEKVAASKFVWVHAYREKDHSFHEKVARAGAWVQFDGVDLKSTPWHIECVRFMQSKGLLNRTMVSQDAGYYRPGQPGGGPFRAFTGMITGMMPKLPADWVTQLLVKNPAAAYG